MSSAHYVEQAKLSQVSRNEPLIEGYVSALLDEEAFPSNRGMSVPISARAMEIPL